MHALCPCSKNPSSVLYMHTVPVLTTKGIIIINTTISWRFGEFASKTTIYRIETPSQFKSGVFGSNKKLNNILIFFKNKSYFIQLF